MQPYVNWDRMTRIQEYISLTNYISNRVSYMLTECQYIVKSIKLGSEANPLK